MYNDDPDMQKKVTLIAFIFTLVLCLLFAAAKIFGFIAWSWLWVFSPFWIPCVIGLILMMIGISPPPQQ
jgi:hypothetical protein